MKNIFQNGNRIPIEVLLTPIMSLMKEVINSCTLVMVMDAAGRNPGLISHRLYKELESYSKVRLSFYKEFEDTIKSLIK